ncbi:MULTISPECIES: hypothetical protein [Lysinibacillus]|uniref:hypothetical protein n=1 Tax=Lysinibacillus TaxID=400634 RepID=UPI001C0F901D|nr:MULTISPECIES: hypothetical protein [Lysinibacillus]MBU5250389.1 hypothetical protein [Lysinibacillus capsici]MCR6524450.1 hypothetical protein [Lysinibacillus capsici]UUV23633.1 hypothetical protein NP781_17645 [Lysinibacillus sp. FN11]UYB46504.1 hypothetical protein OCI51_20250 [Lysinibacillus capsici]
MGDWSKIGLVSKQQFDEQMLNQSQQLEALKELIIESNKIQEANAKSIRKELKALKTRMDLIEEVLKLNWTNELLNQLESNLNEYELQNRR